MRLPSAPPIIKPIATATPARRVRKAQTRSEATMQAAPADNSRLPRPLFCHKRLKDTPRFQAKATFATRGIKVVPLRSTAPDSSNRLTAWSAARAPKIATTAHRRARKGSSLTGCRPTKILRTITACFKSTGVTISAHPHDAVVVQAQPLHRPGSMDIPSSRTDRVRFATARASRGRRSRTRPWRQFPPLSS